MSVLERKLAKVQRQAQAARERRAKAEARSRRLEQRLKRERAQATRALAEHLQEWEQQGVWPFLLRERDLLRQLEDLAASERTMYALDHPKDQTMTLLKLALANLVIWTRDRYFPAPYAQATWHPSSGCPVVSCGGTDTVTVEPRPFNDRRLTHDLVGLCQRVEAAQPRLPDGRKLVLWVASSCRPALAAQQGKVA